MRSVELPQVAGTTSCLGMGCASLGSRVSRRAGTRALSAAYDRGVRWFDVAPAYGAGNAEAILGAFVRTRDDSCRICTKVGLAPSWTGPVKNAVLSAGRLAAGLVGPLRTKLRGTRVSANARVALTPESIVRSLETSLRRLGREHVDVYALHNAEPDDLRREDVLRAVEAVRTSGKAGAISVAGDHRAARAAIAIGNPFSAVQIAMSAGPEAQAIIAAAGAKGMAVVTHSVFGVAGSLAALTRALTARPDLAAELEALGYAGPVEDKAAQLLLKRALAANADGVTLTSMFSRRSLATNTTIAAEPVDPTSIALADRILATVGPDTGQ